MFLGWGLSGLISLLGNSGFFNSVQENICLHKCWKCQDHEDSCLWKFDESQPQNFDTFDCDIACTGEPDPEKSCVDRCSRCKDAQNSCLWDFDHSQPEDFD